MNKQEIIDNLRLEISDRDMTLIDLNARLIVGVNALNEIIKTSSQYAAFAGTSTGNNAGVLPIAKSAIETMTK